MIHENLGTEVEMFAPNGSRITAILDKGECAYHSRFALVETPDGAYTVEREIHESQFFDEDASASLRLGRRLYLGEDGESYTLDQLSIIDAYGNEKRVTALPHLAAQGETEYYRLRVQEALRAAGDARLDIRAFALATYLAEGLPPEQAIPLANATKREDDTVHIDTRDPNIPWREPLPIDEPPTNPQPNLGL